MEPTKESIVAFLSIDTKEWIEDQLASLCDSISPHAYIEDTDVCPHGILRVTLYNRSDLIGKLVLYLNADDILDVEKLAYSKYYTALHTHNKLAQDLYLRNKALIESEREAKDRAEYIRLREKYACVSGR